jgi:hypothetical protein
MKLEAVTALEGDRSGSLLPAGLAHRAEGFGVSYFFLSRFGRKDREMLWVQRKVREFYSVRVRRIDLKVLILGIMRIRSLASGA